MPRTASIVMDTRNWWNNSKSSFLMDTYLSAKRRKDAS